MDFQNKIGYDASSNQKSFSAKGYDSLMCRKSIDKRGSADTCGALDTVEIDEDERQQFVSTLTKLKPNFDQYNTEEIK